MKDEVTYDFVFIGSGMGALVCAVLLARAGYSVCVLEKNHQIGGSLQVFSRDKTIFDTGVHYVGGLSKGQNLNRFFRHLQILDQLNFEALDADCYDQIILPSGTFCHASGYENFMARLVADFPAEESNIRTFCDRIKAVCDIFPLYNMEQTSETAYFLNPEQLEESAWTVLQESFQDPLLISVVSGSIPLFAGEKDSTPFFVMALILNNFISGSYRFVKGGSQIAKALSRELHKHGGVIEKHQEVLSCIYSETGHIEAVSTRSGSQYCAKNFISNLHPKETIRIFGEQSFRPAFRKRVQSLKNTQATFVLYISFHPEQFPYFNYNKYLYSKDDVWECVHDTPEDWPTMMFVCPIRSSANREFADGMTVMTYMDATWLEQWSDSVNTVSNPGERSASYEMAKVRYANRIIDRLTGAFPEIKSAIKNVYSSSPLTFRDFLATPDGSMYGLLKDYKRLAEGTIQPRTSIKNLYFTGQNVVFHGILGTTISGYLTAFEFISPTTLINEIREQHEV